MSCQPPSAVPDLRPPHISGPAEPHRCERLRRARAQPMASSVSGSGDPEVGTEGDLSSGSSDSHTCRHGAGELRPHRSPEISHNPSAVSTVYSSWSLNRALIPLHMKNSTPEGWGGGGWGGFRGGDDAVRLHHTSHTRSNEASSQGRTYAPMSLGVSKGCSAIGPNNQPASIPRSGGSTG